MSKIINSPSSNNSGTSSETSETQSVEDNNPSGSGTPGTPPITGIANSRIQKNWKRMKDTNNDKEAEASKRPPWRTVSVSTLPKPDKNALLRAKLLDASRRMRAGKSAAAVQTDMEPTKLMKEISLGTQPDLILYKEVGILTDGSYAKKKNGVDEFILTYSVSQMTDAIVNANTATQTHLPRVAGDDFMDAYLNRNRSTINYKALSEVERKLLAQAAQIREMQSAQVFNGTTQNMMIDKKPNKNTETSNDMPDISQPHESSTPLKPTLASWHFEYDGFDGERENRKFQPYIINAGRPWRSFAPFQLHAGNQLNDWNLLLIAVDKLIQESNLLVDSIEDLNERQCAAAATTPIVLQPTQTQLPVTQPKCPTLPSDYWLPIIEQQEKELAEMLKNLKPIKTQQFEKFIVKDDEAI